MDHQESIPMGLTVEQAYGWFRDHAQDFAAVVDGGTYIGLISRGHLGFLLGTRFGFTLHSRHSIQDHMLPESLVATSTMNLMDVLEAALCRTGDAFYHDVPVVDLDRRFLGIIPVPSLVRAQSSVIAEQFNLAETQRQELLLRNQDLFRSVHQLRQSQGRYETLFQNSPVGVALLQRDGRIEAYNGKLQELLGTRPETGTPGLNLADLIPPNHRSSFLELLSLHESGAMLPANHANEFPINFPGPGERLFKLYTSLVRETGQICTIFHDITEQRVVERKLAIQDKAALMESLVGGIAHELNNKLSPVLGFAELLEVRLRALEGQDVLENYCGAITRSAQECVRIIRQLLQLSRPATMELHPVDLHGILDEVVSIMRFRIRGADVKLDLTLPEEGLRILADAPQIKQVFVNILINAVDAMDHSSRKDLTVSVETVPGGWAAVSVRDTGHGIPPDKLNRIFDPFYTTKSSERGTGLGLSVCLGIVRQHWGEISVNSIQGEGTEFKVLLPLAPSDPKTVPESLEATRKVDPHATRPPEPAKGTDVNVLVIDDEEYITSLVQELLRSFLGWRVERVHDGREAIHRMETASFDLIITDLRMPGLDGFAILNWVRDFRPSLVSRVLVITGDPGSAVLDQDLLELEVPVLRKPFTPQELLAQCRDLLQPTLTTSPRS
ncbi:ATP-binding protein [Geothrix sp. 21YS21S-2]|uniref:ATP-binding protein n=1 Tax=Geothrix sp. 21YS21S-2 TaxID=3068893 RepID=UPI0027BA0D58|nr:ATP-binding protein [Geothrix sp. 21YS21S-2]